MWLMAGLDTYHLKGSILNIEHSIYLREYSEWDLVPIPQPMLSPGTLAFFESDEFPFMNKANLYDSTDPGFIVPPTAIDSIKEFLYDKWDN